MISADLEPHREARGELEERRIELRRVQVSGDLLHHRLPEHGQGRLDPRPSPRERLAAETEVAGVGGEREPLSEPDVWGALDQLKIKQSH